MLLPPSFLPPSPPPVWSVGGCPPLASFPEEVAHGRNFKFANGGGGREGKLMMLCGVEVEEESQEEEDAITLFCNNERRRDGLQVHLERRGYSLVSSFILMPLFSISSYPTST